MRAARRHHVEAKADALLAVLRAPGLRQPPTTEAAYAAVVIGQVGIITALNEQIAQLQEVVAEHFGRHPAADIYLSQPGFGVVLAARALGEFGDDKKRFARRSGAEELFRAEPDHSSLGEEDRRDGQVRHQPAPRRTRCTCRRSPRSRHHPARGPTTTRSVPGKSVTTPRCANSRTGSSASCTAASRPAPSTTKPQPGSTKTSTAA